MWFLPLAVAFAIAILLAILHFWTQRRNLFGAKSYRRKYSYVINRIETITVRVNAIGAIADSIDEPRVLDYYEGCLRLLETMLETLRHIPPFGDDPSVLHSASHLVRECEDRVKRTERAIKDLSKGRELDMKKLYGRPIHDLLGCYFCSRPYHPKAFKRVKVKLEGQIRNVQGCEICRRELESSRKVKVLYFVRNGEPVHWSKIPEYRPSEDFFHINKRSQELRTPKLELVFSRKD